MEQMKRVFSRMLEDPQAPPLRDSADVMAAARRSVRRSIVLRAAVAVLVAVTTVGSWTLVRNDTSPPPIVARPSATLPAPSAAPMQLTAADVADRLAPAPTPLPPRRIGWLIESRTVGGHIYWYVDVYAPVPDPCELPYDVPHSPQESCNMLVTRKGQVWVRRLPSVPFAARSAVVSIYVPVSPEKAFLYTASNVELPGAVNAPSSPGTWGRGVGPMFEISDDEIARIGDMAHELD